MTKAEHSTAAAPLSGMEIAGVAMAAGESQKTAWFRIYRDALGQAVSRAEAEQEYQNRGAALNTNLTEDIAAWLDKFRDVSLKIASEGATQRKGDLELHARAALLNVIGSYLHLRTQNYTAILANRGVDGAEGVARLREHVDRAIGVIRQRYREALLEVGLADFSMSVKWWPGNVLSRFLTADYERVLCDDPWDAVTRWRELISEDLWSCPLIAELLGSTEDQRSAPPELAEAPSEPLPSEGAAERVDIEQEKAVRRRLLREYKEECKRAGVKVTDEMIANTANPAWHGRTQIQQWQRCNPQYDGTPDRLIRKVLETKPHLKKPKPLK